MAVIDGLKQRDSDAAAAMKAHIDGVVAMIRRLIVEWRDYFAAEAGDVLAGYGERR